MKIDLIVKGLIFPQIYADSENYVSNAINDSSTESYHVVLVL